MRHIQALDGVRGIAILLVMVHHFSLATISHHGVLGIVWRVCEFGWSGVPLFFVLSGYLITRILCASRGSRGYFSTFYARRTLRIFPLYYAVLIVALLIWPAISHVYPSHTAWLWLYGANLPATFPWLAPPSGLAINTSHFWSLAVEEQFYLVWPLLVAVLPDRALAKVALSAVAVALLSRFILSKYVPYVDMFTLSNVDALGIGAWLAVREREVGLAGLRREARIGLLAVAVCIPLVATARLWNHGAQDVVFKRTVLAILFGLGLRAALLSTGRMQTLLCMPWLRATGRYSYAMYVLHFLPPWGFMTQRGSLWINRYVGSPALSDAVWFCGCIALTYVAGWLSWTLFESHFVKLKDLFGQPAEASPTTIR